MPARDFPMLLLLLLLVAPRAARAETPPDTTKPAARAPSLATVKVLSVQVPGAELGTDRMRGDTIRAGIDDIIVLKVANLDSLVRRAQCLSADSQTVTECGKKGIALYLDGREMRGLPPESRAMLLEEGQLQFHLRRTADSVNNETWADLLGAPGLKGNDFYFRPAEVSIGLEDGYPLPTDVTQERFGLIRLHRPWFIGCAIAFAVIVVILVVAAMYTDLLRDVGKQPSGTEPMKLLFKGRSKRVRKPYSLGRVQMAWWFVLVIAAFMFIWLVTGAHDTISPSVLGLVGIGAGTALGAAAIDVGKESSESTELTSLRAKVQPLRDEIAKLKTAMNDAAGSSAKVAEVAAKRTLKQTELNETEERIKALEPTESAQKTECFIRDLLKELSGEYGFHRFQMAVWTLILGLLFIRSVWERLAMPEFSATLLALLGISAGTYVGFKIPEKKTK